MHWKDMECRRLISCINPAFAWKNLSQERRPPSLKPVLLKMTQDCQPSDHVVR